MEKTKKQQAKIRVHPASIKLMTDATWEFANRILWNGFPFSEAETGLAKFYIQEYYEAIPAETFSSTASKHFAAYCERVILARDYVNRFSHRYIPHPCVWLDKRNPKGFAGTKAWYESNKQKRKLQREIFFQMPWEIMSRNNFRPSFFNEGGNHGK